MIASLVLAVLSTFEPCPSSSSAGGAHASVERRPLVAELIDGLDTRVDKRGSEDAEACEQIEKLAFEFAASGPKDRTLIVKALQRCLCVRRALPEKGKFDVRLATRAAENLGRMGSEACAALAGALEERTVRKAPTLSRALALALGATQDKAAVKPLCDLLEDKSDALVAAAGEALGQFAAAPEAQRKAIFEDVLKTLVTAKNYTDDIDQQSASASAPHDNVAHQRYDTISAALNTTLKRLSSHDETDPDQWRHWWNKNKRETWEPKKGEAGA